MIIDRYLVASSALSALFGLVAAGVFYTATRARAARGRAEAMREVVVASDAVPTGAALSKERLKLVRLPVSAVPKGSFSTIEEVAGRAAVSPILVDEPVVEARLAQSHGGVGIAPLIPLGQRAVAVRVNDVAAVAGFVLPGTHVDVLVTARPPGQADLATTTALQDLTVLSVGQTIQADARNPAMTAQVVTLLANPEQAEVLSLASGEARIQLALRNADDRRSVHTQGRRLGGLYGRIPTEAPAIAKPAVPHAAVRKPSTQPVSLPAPPQPLQKAESKRIMVIRGVRATLEPVNPGKEQ